LTRRPYADTSSRMTKVSAVLTTKGVYARRRCRSCRQLFTPRPGGRPALFCNASCKQRAYKVRKKERLRPDVRPRPAQSRGAHPIVTSPKRSIFEPEDVKALFQKCLGARPPEEADFGEIAEDLNLTALLYLSSGLRRSSPSAGADQKWFQGIAGHCKRLLAAIGLNGPPYYLENNETIHAVYRLGILLPPSGYYLRYKMAAEIGAPGLSSEWHIIRAGLLGLQMMMVCAECGAAIAGRDKGARRKTPPEELSLVAKLHELYTNVTGDRRWVTTSPDDGTPGGQFVEFVMAVAAHIHDNLDAMEPAAPTDLAKDLKSLSTSPRRINDRIRRVRKRLKGTNRLRFPSMTVLS
jgi:hypothetical protein